MEQIGTLQSLVNVYTNIKSIFLEKSIYSKNNYYYYFLFIYMLHVISSNPLIEFIDIVGFFAPSILFFISLFLLWSKSYFLIYYIIGFGLNILLNILLKGLIQQPRPKEDIKLINISKNNGKRISYDVYGMPSGHAQLCFYSLGFIYLVFNNWNWTIFYFIISLITLFQRVKYKNHTIHQVLVGAIVGALFSYFIFYISKRNISGKWTNKKDDYALN